MLCKIVAASGDTSFRGLSMRKAGALVVVALFGLFAGVAFADNVPKLDYTKSCRADVAAIQEEVATRPA